MVGFSEARWGGGGWSVGGAAATRAPCATKNPPPAHKPQAPPPTHAPPPLTCVAPNVAATWSSRIGSTVSSSKNSHCDLDLMRET
jgi:hypothetical protein